MKGFATYLAVTLMGAIFVGFTVRETPGAVPGIALAWLIQALAFWRLEVAFEEGRNATAAWLGGLAARLAGLVAAGSASLLGLVSVAVAVAYGASMLVLLLLEAGWLFRRLSWPGAAATGGAGVENGIEGANGS